MALVSVCVCVANVVKVTRVQTKISMSQVPPQPPPPPPPSPQTADKQIDSVNMSARLLFKSFLAAERRYANALHAAKQTQSVH